MVKSWKALGIVGASALCAAGIAVGTAPPADAAAKASYTWLDLVTGRGYSGTTGRLSGNEAEVPPRSPSLDCRDPYLSGSGYALSCWGDDFHVFVDCSDGDRYAYGRGAGEYRIIFTCPSGATALRGGAYGN
ncbi:hypothetical protein [Amycolatopsis sp. lyj-84]|uniref:hypothetical protein n=1 Tax=Amycolatopsis sp. lyj-84 TaxID=2789284 RepID=UPI00397AAA74